MGEIDVAGRERQGRGVMGAETDKRELERGGGDLNGAGRGEGRGRGGSQEARDLDEPAHVARREVVGDEPLRKTAPLMATAAIDGDSVLGLQYVSKRRESHKDLTRGWKM